MKLTKCFLIATLASLLLTGCKDNDYKGGPHLIVTLSDAPSVQFVSLVTSVTKIGLYDGSQWLSRDIELLPFDVMTLTGGTYLTLFDEVIPEGHYSKIRLEFGESNTLTVADTESEYEMVSEPADLVWECDIDFDAVSDRVDVGSVDLDVNRSVTYLSENDRYAFSPRNGCRILDARTEGAVSATAVNTLGAVITSVIQVQFCQGDSVLRSTYCNTENGKLFYRLSPGAYDLRFVPQDEEYEVTQIDSVIVSEAEATALGPVILFPKLY